MENNALHEEKWHNEENSAVYKNQVKLDVSQAQCEIEVARNEWDQVERNVPGLLPSVNTDVTYEDILNHLEEQDMSQFMKSIKPTIKRKGLLYLLHRILGPSAMKKDLVSERNLIFAIAQYPCDLNQSIHSQVLQTIYRELTGMCSTGTTGSHWEEIGFQGNNPTTDLRGAGFLGLVHLLYFVSSPKTTDLAKEIYKLSHHPTQHFPFSVMSINMTRITLEALREELLNRECNKQDKVFSVVNDFYAGIFFYLYTVWKMQKKTIMDSGYVLQDVSKHVKSHTKSVLEGLRVKCTETKKGSKKTETDSLVEFTDIGDITQTK